MRGKKVVLNRQEPAWEEWVSPSQAAPRKDGDHPVGLNGAIDSSIHEVISRLAFSYWEARGFQGGSAEEDWLRAEGEIQLSGVRSRTNGVAEFPEPTRVAALNPRVPQIKRLAVVPRSPSATPGRSSGPSRRNART